MKTCSISGCQRPYHVSGLCNKHYQSKITYGDPLRARTKRKNGEGSVQLGYLVIQKGKVKRFAHVIVAEKALGRALPYKAEVHHVNGNRLDNRSSNLVICPDRAYHKLLHVRMKALDATGDANSRKCKYCKLYDDTSNMQKGNDVSARYGFYYYHKVCSINVCAKRKAARDAAIRDAPQ